MSSIVESDSLDHNDIGDFNDIDSSDDNDSNEDKVVQKFKFLKVNQKYEVREINGPFPSKYDKNKNFYVLLISEFGSKETFTVYSTNMLAEYIDGRKSKKKINFTVAEKNGVKYPIIEGYRKRRNWTVLE
jgi:hypothetical protein